VLAYHRVSDEDDPLPHVDVASFRHQMRWLRRYCEPIQPGQLVSAVHRRNRRVPVLVTFDDGSRNYYQYAYPVLEELGIPAINFLSTRGVVLWSGNARTG
jgi:peptidoglycan/xylan/chitin deacetylase (PgdA/CDA1 family)